MLMIIRGVAAKGLAPLRKFEILSPAPWNLKK